MIILLLESDARQGQSIKSALQLAGYMVEWLTRGDDTLYLLTMNPYDILILSLSLSDSDGLALLRQIRERQIQIPVILLAAENSLQERVSGLDLGADDYLPPPFEIPELEARIRALTRRAYSKNFPGLSVGPLYFDLNHRRAYIDNRPIVLSSCEITLLEALILRSGQVVSKEQLKISLFGCVEGAMGNTIEVYVSRLRKKLAKSGAIIQTVKGLGYRIEKSETINC